MTIGSVLPRREWRVRTGLTEVVLVPWHEVTAEERRERSISPTLAEHAFVSGARASGSDRMRPLWIEICRAMGDLSCERLSMTQLEDEVLGLLASGRLVALRLPSIFVAPARIAPVVSTGPRPALVHGTGRVKHRNLPKETVELEGYEPASRKTKKVRLEKRTYEAYQMLVAAARQAGFAHPLFTVVSGLRSDEHQKKLWADALVKYKSEEVARLYVAKPGGSAHRTGQAIDFYLGHRCASENDKLIRATDAWKWMDEHANGFGFNPYRKEAWHWEFNVE